MDILWSTAYKNFASKWAYFEEFIHRKSKIFEILRTVEHLQIRDMIVITSSRKGGVYITFMNVVSENCFL